MSVSGVYNARVISGYLVKGKVPSVAGYLASQANRHCVRPSRRSLQTLNATEEGNVASEEEAEVPGVEAIERLLENNRIWAEKITKDDPDFFPTMAKGQTPEYLWIGCADSRCTNNLCTGTKPGEMFTHRNVGNLVIHSDMNCMSCIEFSVLNLKVKHVIVCGHYYCGAVGAALTMSQSTPGVTNHWIHHIRSVMYEHANELEGLEFQEKYDRLCEVNAVKQAFHVCTTPTIQRAWENDQEVHVHAVIFDLATGRLRRLAGPISGPEQAEAEEEAARPKEPEEDIPPPEQKRVAGKPLRQRIGNLFSRIFRP